MKRGFTLIELVVVVVLVGILSAVAIPRLQRDGLIEAVDQVVAHIRYAQHLAMQDNKFSQKARNGEPSKWYVQRWNVAFNQTNDRCGSDDKFWKYTIFYDIDSRRVNDFSGNLNSLNEVAIDPSNRSKILSAGWSGISRKDCELITNKFNLGKNYGITDIKFSKECGSSRVQTISFDEFGRPLKFVTSTSDNSAAKRSHDKILTKKCEITLQTSRSQAIISIQPMTGFLSVEYKNL